MVLVAGMLSFRSGNHVRSQKLMRARVVAQGFTVVAVVYGFFNTWGVKLQERDINATPQDALLAQIQQKEKLGLLAGTDHLKEMSPSLKAAIASVKSDRAGVE